MGPLRTAFVALLICGSTSVGGDAASSCGRLGMDSSSSTLTLTAVNSQPLLVMMMFMGSW
jgi:hypothetical protein